MELSDERRYLAVWCHRLFQCRAVDFELAFQLKVTGYLSNTPSECEKRRSFISTRNISALQKSPTHLIYGGNKQQIHHSSVNLGWSRIKLRSVALQEGPGHQYCCGAEGLPGAQKCGESPGRRGSDETPEVPWP